MPDRVTQLTRTKPVPYLITGSLLVLTLMSFVPASLNAAQGGKTEVFPVQKAAPAVVVIETAGSEMELRHQLRAKNGVSELAPSTSVIRFSVAPTGSFGFIPAKLLGLALITQSPDLPLEQVPPATNAYEIHKLADGSGMLVGFVEANLTPQLTPSHRPKNVRLGLYSNPSDKAPHIVAVPLVKLIVDRMPIRLDAKEPDSAVLLDMDLQSTANRTSSQTGP
ncbi:MAG: hypothetical protein EWM73_03652 [Nitrospira sp.]|nr:MAG: hypothetical protein EWM73_03652 [Nitrospira sp.]